MTDAELRDLWTSIDRFLNLCLQLRTRAVKCPRCGLGGLHVHARQA